MCTSTLHPHVARPAGPVSFKTASRIFHRHSETTNIRMGIPWLTMDQQIRVDKANNLYSITCRLIRLCEDHQILWSCENPGRSFMWQTTPFQELFSTMQCLSTGLHHCMFGSSRRKLTRLIPNISSFHHLHQLCDNSHEHEPWGQKPDGS